MKDIDHDSNHRTTALRGYGLLDTPNEPEFDAIVRDAARSLRVPIALISLLDENCQWFKAQIGLEVSETPLSMSFCTHAVQKEGMFEVQDATKDERFEHNPLVTGHPNIRSYAGVPLRTSEGTRVGTICVLGDKPRDALSEADKRKLLTLADKVMKAMEVRRRRRT